MKIFTLNDLADILKSANHTYQPAILWDIDKCEDASPEASIEYLIKNYPNWKVYKISAYNNLLIISGCN